MIKILKMAKAILFDGFRPYRGKLCHPDTYAKVKRGEVEVIDGKFYRTALQHRIDIAKWALHLVDCLKSDPENKEIRHDLDEQGRKWDMCHEDHRRNCCGLSQRRAIGKQGDANDMGRLDKIDAE